MEISQLIPFAANNGLAIVLIFYFLKNNNNTNQELKEVIKELKNSNDKLNENITTLLKSCLIKKKED
jgi:hypothetical protein